MKKLFADKYITINILCILLLTSMAFVQCDGNKTTLKEKVEGDTLPALSDSSKTKTQNRRPSQ